MRLFILARFKFTGEVTNQSKIRLKTLFFFLFFKFFHGDTSDYINTPVSSL